jgi:hypothetical protein
MGQTRTSRSQPRRAALLAENLLGMQKGAEVYWPDMQKAPGLCSTGAWDGQKKDPSELHGFVISHK